MSWIYIKPLQFRYQIHFTGAGYYYTDASGAQLSKHYKTVQALRTHGRVLIWD